VKFDATTTLDIDLAGWVCPHSRLALEVPYAVYRQPGTSHNFDDNDHDEMQRMDAWNAALLWHLGYGSTSSSSWSKVSSSEQFMSVTRRSYANCKRCGPFRKTPATTMNRITSWNTWTSCASTLTISIS